MSKTVKTSFGTFEVNDKVIVQTEFPTDLLLLANIGNMDALKVEAYIRSLA